jgi:hypothetical protein
LVCGCGWLPGKLDGAAADDDVDPPSIDSLRSFRVGAGGLDTVVATLATKARASLWDDDIRI